MTSTEGERVHERIERTHGRFEEGAELSPSAARRILEARAQLLAQPLPAPATFDDTLELLVFSRAGGTYAVEAGCVIEVVPLVDPTPVPWVPPAVVGVVNHRGRIVPVVDVARLLPPAAGEASESALGVIVVAGEASFGIRADAVAGVVRLEEREVQPAAELADERDTVIRGLTAAMVAVLDVEALAHDARVEVNDEVE